MEIIIWFLPFLCVLVSRPFCRRALVVSVHQLAREQFIRYSFFNFAKTFLLGGGGEIPTSTNGKSLCVCSQISQGIKG